MFSENTRRAFLRKSALAVFGIGSAPAWLNRAALAGAVNGRKKTLVSIFQRGAMDGLNVVVPHGDKAYYSLRPTIAIPATEAIELDGFFGLHPAMAAFKPLFESKQLAIVHAAGSPDPTRSHFDAQDYMESGTPGFKATRDGWLNRALPPEPSVSPIRAVALGGSMPRSLRGLNPAVSVNNISQFNVRDNASSDFEEMYAGSVDTVLKGTGKETFEAVRLLESINKAPYTPAGGAQYPGSRLGQSLQQIARLIKSDAGVEVAFADTPGWDTHINEAPQLANLLRDFTASIAAFHADLGDRMDDVILVTMSEFGRTARENGNRGTDHGHANAMFVLGGGVRGGKVHGRWPGLAREQLYEGRDLALTTDFRDVLGELVAKQLGASNLAKVFPGYTPADRSFRGILA